MPLTERAGLADVVVTAKILYTSPIPGQRHFYTATFRVVNILKGFHVFQVGAAVGVKRFRFVEVTHPRDRAPGAYFGDDFYTVSLERIVVACNSSFPLPARLWIVAR